MNSSKNISSASQHLSSSDCREQLNRICSSDIFCRCPRRKDFLEYIVEEELSGNGSRLKAYTIAVDVFSKSSTFDPNTDTIVRVEAGRIRNTLKKYYENEGKHDPIRIDIPVGSYIPTFEKNNKIHPIITQNTASPDHQLTAKIRSYRRSALKLLIVFGIIPAALYLFSQNIGSLIPSKKSGNIVPHVGPLIFVLPFQMVKSDINSYNNQVGKELTDKIIFNLAAFKNLSVVADNSFFDSKNNPVDIRLINDRYKVDYIVDGKISIYQNKIHINVQLIDTKSLLIVWISSYDKKTDKLNYADVINEITAQITGDIASSHGAVNRVMMNGLKQNDISNSLGSYQCTLRVHEYYRSLTRDKHYQAEICLENVIQQHPNYVKALSSIALLKVDKYKYGYTNSTDELDIALQYINLALENDPQNQFAHSVLAKVSFYHGDIKKFHIEANKAIELNPYNSEVLASMGQRIFYIGEKDNGISLIKQAIFLNKEHPDWFLFPIAEDLYWKGEYSKALNIALRINMPNYWCTYLTRAMIYGQLGDEDKAKKAYDKFLKLYPHHPREVVNYWKKHLISNQRLLHIIDGLKKAGSEVS